jgi:hypothetical protein
MTRIAPVHSPHRVALENAIRYVEEAEHCDSGGQPEDRDVRLKFAKAWALIALASKETANDQSGM